MCLTAGLLWLSAAYCCMTEPGAVVANTGPGTVPCCYFAQPYSLPSHISACKVKGCQLKVDFWLHPNLYPEIVSSHSLEIMAPAPRGADKSLARPTSPCILFDGEKFLLVLVLLYTYIYIHTYIYTVYSTNIPPIMIISRVYEYQNLLSL